MLLVAVGVLASWLLFGWMVWVFIRGVGRSIHGHGPPRAQAPPPFPELEPLPLAAREIAPPAPSPEELLAVLRATWEMGLPDPSVRHAPPVVAQAVRRVASLLDAHGFSEERPGFDQMADHCVRTALYAADPRRIAWN